MSEIEVARSVAGLRDRVSGWRRNGESVGMVPTMGALHDGHLSLVAAARKSCSHTVATLFVNPKQFGPNEDLAVYPRTEDSDRVKLDAAGVDLLFAPDVGEMYPDGHSVSVSVGPIGEVLEGAHRPGFFTGVATVVSKLLIQAMADRAFFGEKDFQQLQVIRRLARDLNIPTEIVGVPTVREVTGLAMSSRNAFLSGAERAVAPALYRALEATARRVRGGEPVKTVCEIETAALLAAGFASVDYLTVVEADGLSVIGSHDDLRGRPGRVLCAASLGTTRLIDNLAI